MVVREGSISFYKYLGGTVENGNLNSSVIDHSQIPWHEVFEPLPREDCDKWNHWNSLMFSFTAITTIGTNRNKMNAY